MTADTSSRLIELDSLRGIAALTVVVHHAYLTLLNVPAWWAGC